jgi:hypothetical protein
MESPLIRALHLSSRRGELFVLQDWCFDQLKERVTKQIRISPIVEPKRHLIKVSGKMPSGDLTIQRHLQIECWIGECT